MIKKLLIGASTVLLLGGVLFGIGSAADPRPNVTVQSDLTTTGSDTPQQSNAGSSSEDSTASLQNNHSGAPKENKREMEPFSNIEISVIGADIHVVEGDDYAVDYQFHNREVVERLEISNDTLYLSTGYNWEWKPEHGNFYVVVTVPKGTPLKVVNLSTVAGDIVIENQAYTSGALGTTSGKVALTNVTAEQVKAQTVSGAISVKESKVQDLSADNKTGHIELHGEFATVNAYSVSSPCELNGSLSEAASIETVSGEITVAVSNSASIEANSYGKIYWNECKQGYSFVKADGDAQLTLQSVSGKISVTEGTAKG